MGVQSLKQFSISICAHIKHANNFRAAGRLSLASGLHLFLLVLQRRPSHLLALASSFSFFS